MENNVADNFEQKRIEKEITDISADLAMASGFAEKALKMSTTSNAILVLVQQKLEDLYVSLEKD